MRHPRSLAGALLLSAIAFASVLTLLVQPAEAAFPGQNGRIFFTTDRSGTEDIFAVRADRTGLSPVIKLPGEQDNAALSPDGGRLAFGMNGDVYVKSLTTGKTKRLTESLGDDTDPSWSPGGDKLVFASARDENEATQPTECKNMTNYNIYVMNADGTGEKRLGKDTPCGVQISPAYSPRGDRIAYEGYVSYQSTCWGPWGPYTCYLGSGNVYVVKPGGTPKSLTNAGDGDFYGNPSWSPNGSKIVMDGFTNNHGGDSLGDVFTIGSIPGGTPKNLTTDMASSLEGNPSWSPDGKRIAFSSNRDGNGEIYVMRAADGSGKTNVTRNAANDSEPDWGRR